MLALLVASLFLTQDPNGASSRPAPSRLPPVAAWLERLDALARRDPRHGTFGSTGDRLWLTELAARPGMTGVAHWVHHTSGFVDPMPVRFFAADGREVLPKPIEETWRPTHSETVYELAQGGRLHEARFLTASDVFVSRLELVGPCDLDARYRSAYAERAELVPNRFVPTSLVAVAQVDLARDGRVRVGAPDAPVLLEGEAHSEVQGTTGPDRKRAASGGAVLGRGFGGDAGHRATWDFLATGEGRWDLWIRYARVGAKPARFRVEVRGAPLAEVEFAPTGGWGDQDAEFATLAVPLPELPAGPASVALVAQEPAANTNIDFLAVVPHGPERLPAPDALKRSAAPPMRGVLTLPASGVVLSGVPFQTLAGRRAQGALLEAPLAIAGKGSLLHVLVVPLHPEATLSCGDTTFPLGPRGEDLAASHRTFVVPADAELTVRTKDALLLAITREAPPPGADERRGEIRFHGLRSETRATLHGATRGERIALRAGERRTLWATFEVSGDRPPGFATSEVLAAPDPLAQHRERTASWYATNAPVLVSGDPLLDRLWTYRWFLVRHNLARPAAGLLAGPVVYEGRHGSWYPRVISFSTPHIVAEARWLADPELWVGNVRVHVRTQEADGVMRNRLVNWEGAHYTNWIPESVVEACKVRGDRELLRDLLPALAREVEANARVFDGDRDGLLAPGDHYATGMEFQPAFWFHSGYDDSKPETKLERVEFASYHYGNAMAVAEGAALLGDAATKQRMEPLAGATRSAVLAKLWQPADAFFYAARESDGDLARCKEVVGFYPFRFGLPPATPEYARAFAALVDEKAFWVPFPPASCSQDVPVFSAQVQRWPGPGGVVTACMWNGPSWPHATSIVADAMARVLRSPAPGVLRPAHLRALLDRFARLHAEGGDPGKLLLREYADATSGVMWGCADYMHSTFADLMIRHVFGIVPRFDDVLEVRPLPLGFERLRCEDIPYHGRRVTIEIEGSRLRVSVDGKRLGEGSVQDGLFLGGALR